MIKSTKINKLKGSHITSIHFDGFWLNPADLPIFTGIYTVFAVRVCNNAITSARILYTGKAKDILDRHVKGNKYVHNHKWDFVRQLKEGEQLAYTAAEIDGRQLDKVENALVYMQQTPINHDLTKSYNHEADEFFISGAGADDFRYQHFGFSVDNDCDSFYSVDYVDDFDD